LRKVNNHKRFIDDPSIRHTARRPILEAPFRGVRRTNDGFLTRSILALEVPAADVRGRNIQIVAQRTGSGI